MFPNVQGQQNFEQITADLKAGNVDYFHEMYPRVMGSVNKHFVVDIPYAVYQAQAKKEMEMLRKSLQPGVVHIIDFIGDSSTKTMATVNSIDLLMEINKPVLENPDFHVLQQLGYAFIGMSPYYFAVNDVAYFVKPLTSANNASDPGYVTLHVAHKDSNIAFKMCNDRRLFNNNQIFVNEMNQLTVNFLHQHGDVSNLDVYNSYRRLETDYIKNRFHNEEFLRANTNMSDVDIQRYLG